MKRRFETELNLAGGRALFEKVLAYLRKTRGLEPGRPAESTFDDEYVDSPDQWLARAGAELRRRRMGARVRLALKPLRGSALGLRSGIEQDEPAATAERAARLASSGPIRRFLAECGCREALEPVLALRTVRMAVTVALSGGGALDVAWDRIEAASAKGAEPEDSWEEVEIGAVGADSAPLQGVIEDLAATFGQSACGVSRLERGLAAIGRSLRRSDAGMFSLARPSDTVADTVGRVLAFHLEELHRSEPGARLGLDILFVHDMRVAARRLRTALKVFGGALPPKTLASLDRDLKWVTGFLGPVRDLDVYIAGLPAYARYVDSQDHTQIRRYARILESRREAARAEMIACLDSARYRRFLDTFAKLLEQGGSRLRSGLAATQTLDAAESLIRPALDRVLRRGAKAIKDPTPQRLHRLRVACKKLRYVCEWLTGLYGKRFAKFARRVTRLQELLGAHHDACVAIEETRSIAHDHPDIPPAVLLAAGQMIPAKQKVLLRVEREFPKRWGQLSDPQHLRRYLLDPMARARSRRSSPRKQHRKP